MPHREFYDLYKVDILRAIGLRANTARNIAKRLNLQSFSAKRYFLAENPQNNTLSNSIAATVTQFVEDVDSCHEEIKIKMAIINSYNQMS